MTARILICLLLAAAAPAAAARTPQLEVSVTRTEAESLRVYEVEASGTVRAAPEQVWKVLTDYGRLAEFVPDLRSSRVLSRNGNEAVVEQLGEARFLFIRRPVHLVVRVTEQPPARIDIALVDGDMKVYRCRWLLAPLPATGGTRITYSGRIAPRFWVPGMLGANIVRSDVERMMGALLARLERPAQAP